MFSDSETQLLHEVFAEHFLSAVHVCSPPIHLRLHGMCVGCPQPADAGGLLSLMVTSFICLKCQHY